MPRHDDEDDDRDRRDPDRPWDKADGRGGDAAGGATTRKRSTRA